MTDSGEINFSAVQKNCLWLAMDSGTCVMDQFMEGKIKTKYSKILNMPIYSHKWTLETPADAVFNHYPIGKCLLKNFL